jgi:hypothetical protein
MQATRKRSAASLFLLSRYFHDFAPALGFDGKHGAELAGAAGNRNGAQLGEPPFDDGTGERGFGTVPSPNAAADPGAGPFA